MLDYNQFILGQTPRLLLTETEADITAALCALLQQTENEVLALGPKQLISRLNRAPVKQSLRTNKNSINLKLLTENAESNMKMLAHLPSESTTCHELTKNFIISNESFFVFDNTALLWLKDENNNNGLINFFAPSAAETKAQVHEYIWQNTKSIETKANE